MGFYWPKRLPRYHPRYHSESISFWLFNDLKKLPGKAFVAATTVKAKNWRAAVSEAVALDLHPGVDTFGMKILDRALEQYSWCLNRLIYEKELFSKGFEMEEETLQ